VARTVIGAGVVVVLGAGAPRESSSDEAAKACAASFEQAQALQKSLRLEAARVAAVACTASTCPAFVRDVCVPLVASIDAAQPTLVLSAQDSTGTDLVSVRVDLDGKLLVPRLGADAVAVDPGEHSVRFIFGAEPPVEQHLLLRVGEKNRAVKATFPSPRSARLPLRLSSRVHPSRPRRRREDRYGRPCSWGRRARSPSASRLVSARTPRVRPTTSGRRALPPAARRR
jgi:hypothetical protein